MRGSIPADEKESAEKRPLQRSLMRTSMLFDADGKLVIDAGLLRRFGFRVSVEEPAFRTAAAFQYIPDLLERE